MKRGTKIMIAITILTVFDFVATFIGLNHGFVVEINPLANMLFQQSLAHGMIIIGLITAASLLILWEFIDKYKWTHYAGMFVIGFKSAIAYFHIYWIVSVLGGVY